MAKRPFPLEFRKEKIFHVLPAVSTNNIFGGTSIPQHPQMGPNNYNSAHQDSYCSESVGLTGPTGKTLKLITQYQPYGLFGVMGCNSHGQFIATGLTDVWSLVVFNADCRILSATSLVSKKESLSGAYFYLNEMDNAVIVVGNYLKCYPTAIVTPKDKVYPLEPLWSSDNLVTLITGSSEGNRLYCALPVWGVKDHYWCMLAGDFNRGSGILNSNAVVAIVQINVAQPRNVVTKLVAQYEVPNCYINNSIAADETGLYVAFNKVKDASTPASTGLLACYTMQDTQLIQKWGHDYDSCGRLLVGQLNIGSGTTPTISVDSTGRKLVSITDNDSPRVNVVVVDATTGELVSKTPLFSKMRSADEASLIGVQDRIVAENNFGHTSDYPYHQYVSNEPGMTMINPKSPRQGGAGEVVWENSYTTYFGMSMLARESGIIFAFSGSWSDPNAESEKGPEYSIVAMDSFDGRIIWRIPVGHGAPYCHEYGGVYFNPTNNGIYIGANDYIFSIQEVEEGEMPQPQY